MTINLTAAPAAADTRIPTARRLATVARLMAAAPELDIERAAAIVDAAAIALEAGARAAALAVLELAAGIPAADVLVDALTLG